MAQRATSPALRRRALVSTESAAHPALTLVARPQVARSSLPFTLISSIVLIAAIAAMLFMSIAAQSTSYAITQLQEESKQLSERAAVLQEKEHMLSTPQELERQARELGMVPAGNVAYIDLATGTVIGEAGVAQEAKETTLVPNALTERAKSSMYDYGMGNERAR